MQLICDTLTGDNVGMGETKFSPTMDQTVYEVKFDIPNESLAFFTFDGKALVKKAQPSIDKMQAVNNFNTNVFLVTLLSQLQNMSNFDLRLEGGNLARFCDAKNFAALKQYLQLLISKNIATKNDYALINTTAQQQGVDLDNP